MKDLELVVFDMAGTTVAVTDQVPEAFREAFGHAGIGLGDAEIAGARGKSKRDAIAELLTRHGQSAQPGRVERIHADFQDALAAALATGGVQAMPGALTVFGRLRKSGIKVALTTGFDQPIVDRLLAALGWHDAVDAVICAADVERGRPAPDLIHEAMRRTGVTDAKRVAAVGDTRSDLLAAEAAGAGWAIGVTSGAHSREQLEACPHTVIIGTIADLPALLGH